MHHVQQTLKDLSLYQLFFFVIESREFLQIFLLDIINVFFFCAPQLLT